MSKYLFILVFLCTTQVQATLPTGFTPSFLTSRDSIIKPERKHSPKLATIMSIALPGLGQAYNKKYWKIPVIYAALGISGYYILRNKDSMKQRQDALTVMLDGDSTTNPPGKYAKIPVDVLKAQRNLYRTNRDYSIIIFAGFYLLNIVDAAVDAHFYNFNIDKPLAQQRHKNWHIYSSRIGNTPAVGLSWTF
jgi:hypothetical protein